MKHLLPAILLFAAAAYPAFAYELPSGPPAKIDFSWRTHSGDFPKDKPGYLILTTEDAVRWSRMLPEFVKQKEAMGFHVYLATEKDYGAGLTGNAQAARVRAWMREFNKRAGLRYALLIGDSSPRSADLPSATIPDGEKGGLDSAYADLGGAWVDIYLAATTEEVRAHPNHDGQGSFILTQAFKTGGKRHDDLMMSRIAYVGTEVGNGAYDLDRILEKTIRYERDTVAGKNLDWRGNSFSITSNYGSGNWDTAWLKSLEREGGTFELRSTRGWIGDLPPENVVDGRELNSELLSQTQRRGQLATMSHGWNRGCEGITGTGELLRDVDPRYPSVVSVATCTGFALADNGNLGQTWLRSGAIFANGTGWSGNNNCRVPLQTRLLNDRVSVGEAGRNEVDQYGDPSLRVFPPKGTPMRALQVAPAVAGDYEERTMYPDTAVRPVTRTYTLTNHTARPMRIALETNAPWLALSAASVTINPGDTTKITATSNRKLNMLSEGNHVADIRFRREDGQTDVRRLALALQPVTLVACYAFDPTPKGDFFPDLTIIPGLHRDIRSMPLARKAAVTPENKNPGMEPIPGFGVDPHGKVGSALRLDNPKVGWSRVRAFGFPRWRGISTAFWFKIGELPAAKQTTEILAEPFKLNVDATGLLTFAGNAKPGKLAAIKSGEWHYVQLRTALADGKVKAVLDGAGEASVDATGVSADGLKLGSFTGSMDELKVWSGELRDRDVAKVFAESGRPFTPTPVMPAVGVVLAEGGELRAPKKIPAVLEMKDPSVKLDISAALAANGLTCTLRDAPEWLDFKGGVFSLKPGANFDHIDFGGYDVFLVLAAKDGPFAGCVCEHTLKVRIPVPEVRIRITRAADNTLSIGSPDPVKRPLAKGVIRYTLDGSPVTEKSPAYVNPFKTVGTKVTARFFYLGEYPYGPVTMASEFGIPRETWKVLAVSGNGGQTACAIDGRSETAWKNVTGVLPQFYAWDLGRRESLNAISVQSTISVTDGRIKDYILSASDDGKKWKLVKSGELENSPNALRITFATPLATRYLKLEATSLHDGKNMVISEIEAFAK